MVTILHTSDMHNKLAPNYAAALREIKESFPECLLLDSGDAIWAGNVYWRPGGEPQLDLMNTAGYDAMCVGNREFHFWSTPAKSKTSRAAFPILSANLRAARKGKRVPAKPCVTFERGGLKIAVVGLSAPNVTERMLLKKVSDYYFEQPIAAAAEVVPRLRREHDLVIALTHIGIARDRELARSVAGIDLILGGHTHIITEEPVKVGDTYILHHGFHSHYVGKVDIDLGARGLEILERTHCAGEGTMIQGLARIIHVTRVCPALCAPLALTGEGSGGEGGTPRLMSLCLIAAFPPHPSPRPSGRGSTWRLNQKASLSIREQIGLDPTLFPRLRWGKVATLRWQSTKAGGRVFRFSVVKG